MSTDPLSRDQSYTVALGLELMRRRVLLRARAHEIAELAGMTHYAVLGAEKGQLRDFRVTHLVNLAAALKTEPHAILTEVDRYVYKHGTPHMIMIDMEKLANLTVQSLYVPRMWAKACLNDPAAPRVTVLTNNEIGILARLANMDAEVLKITLIHTVLAPLAFD